MSTQRQVAHSILSPGTSKDYSTRHAEIGYRAHCDVEISKLSLGRSSTARIIANQPTSEWGLKSGGSWYIAPWKIGSPARFFLVSSKCPRRILLTEKGVASDPKKRSIWSTSSPSRSEYVHDASTLSGLGPSVRPMVREPSSAK